MAKDSGISIKELIGGVAFTALLTIARYLTGQPLMGVFSIIVMLLIGTLATHFIIRKDHPVSRNVWLQIILLIAFWTITNPVSTMGNNIILKKAEFMSILIMALLFIGKDISSAINKVKQKPVNLAPGIIGSLLFLWLINSLGLSDAIWGFVGQHWLSIILLILIWWVFLGRIVKKQILKLTGSKGANKVLKVFQGR